MGKVKEKYPFTCKVRESLLLTQTMFEWETFAKEVERATVI